MVGSSTVTLRRVELSDSDAVSRLVTQLGYPTTPAEMTPRLNRLLSNSEYQMFVATRSGQAVGIPKFVPGRGRRTRRTSRQPSAVAM